MWYVLTRADNGYPVLVYAEDQKDKAELAASKNGMRVVPVCPISEQGGSMRRVSSTGAYLEYARQHGSVG